MPISAWSPLDTFETGCYASEAIFSDPVTTTSARLNWSPISGAVGYEIRGKRIGTSNWVTIQVGNFNSFKDVFGLQSGF